MKSKFSLSWNKSKQPRKQRKFVANAPLHVKRKLLGSPLDKPLKEKHNRKTIEVRKNDEVKVMRGKYAKKQGKVLEVDVRNTRIQIDGITMSKKDGEKAAVWFHPSNIKIIKLDDSDNKRMKKKKVVQKETTKTPKKEESNVTKPKTKEKK